MTKEKRVTLSHLTNVFLGMLVHACNPSSLGGQDRGLQVPSQPRQCSSLGRVSQEQFCFPEPLPHGLVGQCGAAHLFPQHVAQHSLSLNSHLGTLKAQYHELSRSKELLKASSHRETPQRKRTGPPSAVCRYLCNPVKSTPSHPSILGTAK